MENNLSPIQLFSGGQANIYVVKNEEKGVYIIKQILARVNGESVDMVQQRNVMEREFNRIQQIGMRFQQSESTSYRQQQSIIKTYQYRADGRTNNQILPEIDMEVCFGGSLYSYIRTQTLTERQVCDIMSQLVQNLLGLKQNLVQHKDISLKNILVESDSFGEISVKIADFGLSIIRRQRVESRSVIPDSQSTIMNNLQMCTLNYISPQYEDYFLSDQSESEPFDLYKNDIYSLGLCFLFMHFPNADYGELRRRIIQQSQSRQQLEVVLGTNIVPVSQLVYGDLIEQMLRYDENERISIEELETQIMNRERQFLFRTGEADSGLPEIFSGEEQPDFENKLKVKLDEEIQEFNFGNNQVLQLTGVAKIYDSFQRRVLEDQKVRIKVYRLENNNNIYQNYCHLRQNFHKYTGLVLPIIQVYLVPGQYVIIVEQKFESVKSEIINSTFTNQKLQSLLLLHDFVENQKVFLKEVDLDNIYIQETKDLLNLKSIITLSDIYFYRVRMSYQLEHTPSIFNFNSIQSQQTLESLNQGLNDSEVQQIASIQNSLDRRQSTSSQLIISLKYRLLKQLLSQIQLSYAEYDQADLLKKVSGNLKNEYLIQKSKTKSVDFEIISSILSSQQQPLSINLPLQQQQQQQLSSRILVEKTIKNQSSYNSAYNQQILNHVKIETTSIGIGRSIELLNKFRTSLKSVALNFSGIGITVDDCRNLMNCISSLQFLECLSLDLAYNKINDQSGRIIIQGITQLELLKELHLFLRGHSLGSQVVGELRQLLTRFQNNKSVVQLD